uniref:Uncharacterized protein n=1 Tax=Ciona intestinalis TaxID=7719 RepID=H2XXG6_CIOIN
MSQLSPPYYMCIKTMFIYYLSRQNSYVYIAYIYMCV